MQHTRFSNHNSIEKRRSREKVYKVIQGNKKRPLNVLTLPSTNFLLEKRIAKLKGIELICVERDPVIYKQALSNSCASRYLSGDVFDWIHALQIKFDVLWLDLCSPLSMKLRNDIFYLIQSDKLSSNCFFAITLMAAREPQGSLLADIYNYPTMQQFREKGFSEIVISFAKSVGKDCKLVETYLYNSTGTPMIMYSFTIKNK